ncbi:hypothetical protein ER308_05340 [Egibacter rhizosphaerae]|uniref:4-oxalocrotonate tautomerase domain-containing protein n=1 Tax=Egibacter rhizosphaerae TaxID=1670831 RepID=A0A411YCX1_9ACTN|nr:hypothetical protein [Egibacter rhizosphaerae]QBI19025.1 hypothetical protein ER308_05340 [Egibacter rhizosphaerae]
MANVKLHVAPDQTPEEEQRLVARVAQAVSEHTGDETVSFELVESENVQVNGTVADRMQAGDRWNA